MEEFVSKPIGVLTKARADALYAPISLSSAALLLAGRAGGQTAYGGTGAGENLVLNSTSHATKGQVQIATSTMVVDGATGLVGIGKPTPASKLDIAGNLSRTSWTTQGANFAVEANTLTDTSGSGTIALRAANSIGIPTLASSGAETLTSAVNVYIAGGPIQGENVTMTQGVALRIDTGADANVALVLQNTNGSPTTQSMVEWRSTSGVRMASVSAEGYFFIGRNATPNSNDTLVVNRISTDVTNVQTGANIGISANHGSSNANQYKGVNLSASVQSSSSFNLTSGFGGLIGGSFGANHNGSGTVSDARAGSFSITGKIITDAHALIVADSSITAANTWTNFYGLRILQPSGSGTLTNNYGLHIGAMTKGATLNYAIYTNAGVVRFGGNVGLGIDAPAQALHIFDGHLRMDQVAPAGAPTVATGAAGVLTGAYIYSVTFVTATGETSAGSSSSTVNPASQQVSLTAIPVSADANVTSRKIYRTAAGAAIVTARLVTTIADNTTTIYTDNATDASISAAGIIPYKNTTGGKVFVGANRVMFADATFTGLGVGAGNGTASGGDQSVAIGASALGSVTTGASNTAVGNSALPALTTGGSNIAIGSVAGLGITTGSSNMLIGNSAGRNNQTGSFNVWIGSSAGNGAGNNSNSNNVGIGFNAGGSITTGGNNVLLGYNAGNNLTSGGSNLIIGYNLNAQSATASNQMSIGNLLFSAGIDGTGTTLSTGNLGISIAAPTALLHLAGNRSAASWTTTGRMFAIDAATLTDTTGSGTIAFRAINSIGVPTLIGSSSQTLTMSANVYIAGAPVASTNVTQTKAVALFIDSGAAGSVALVLRDASAQIANMLEIMNNSGTVVFSVTGNGNINVLNNTSNASLSATTFNLSSAGASATLQNNTATAASPLLLKSGSNADVGSYVGVFAGGVEQLRITNAALTITDARDIILGTTTGTKIGTATSQKLAVWNKTPIVQPTTGITAAAFVANSSGIVDDTATYGGYTMGQIAAALIASGWLA